MRAEWRGGFLVALVCLVCYGNALDGGFYYDDYHSILDNPSLRSLANWPVFFADPGAFSADAEKRMYRPLLLLSYALNYAVGEYRPPGYKLFNLLLHLLCSQLVWRLGRRLLPEPGQALFAGVLFAAHPLAAEPVNYISSRSESLAAFFYLGALLLHLDGGKRGRWAGAALYALGLLVKSVVLTLPAALWLADRWLLDRRRSWRFYLPHAAVAGFYLGIILHNRFLGDSLAAPVRPWSAQLWTQMKAPAYYLKLLFLPRGLSVEHPFSTAGDPWQAAVLGGGVLLLSLVYLLWKGRRRLEGFVLSWAGLILLPTFFMPLNMLVNERRLYLPLAGFAWGCGALFGRQRLLLAAVPLLAVLTWSRNPVWKDELSLWRDAAVRAPQAYRVQSNLGSALQRAGRPQEALAAFERALRLDDRHGDVYNNIAILHHLEGRLDEAILWYEKALQRYPAYEEIYQNLADAYAQKGELGRSIEYYERALEIDPRRGSIWNNYGQSLYRAEEWDRAATAFARAAELLPDYPEPYNNLGNLRSRQEDFEGAVVFYRRALEAAPESVEVLANLGDALRQSGRLEEAEKSLALGLRIHPQSVRLRLGMSAVLRQSGRFEEALVHLEKALWIEPDSPRLLVEMGELRAGSGRWEEAARVYGQVLQADSTYSRAWYGLAQSLEQLQRKAEAVAAWRRFLSTWPRRDGRYQRARQRLAELEAER